MKLPSLTLALLLLSCSAHAAPNAAIASQDTLTILNSRGDAEMTVATDGPYAGVEMADLNGDGELDLFFVRYQQHPNGVLFADGEGGHVDSGQNLGLADSWDVALGDFDGDGDIDALVANTSSSQNPSCEADRLWTNDGRGMFTDSGQTFEPRCTYSWLTGDLDGDGDLDAVAVQGSGAVVYLNEEGILMERPRPMTHQPGKERGGALGDLDGDGDLDLALASDGVNSTWVNDGRGGFAKASTFGAANSFAIALHDLDWDLDLDAVIANRGEPNRIWLNDGSGRFQDAGQRLGDGYSLDVGLLDADGDGDMDALVANRATPNRLWLNHGNGSFQDSGLQLGPGKSRHVSIDDSPLPLPRDPCPEAEERERRRALDEKG